MEKEKIEVWQLGMFYGFNLKCIVPNKLNEDRSKKVFTIKGLESVLTKKTWVVLENILDTDEIESVEFDNIIPLVRPLSDIKKDILHDGEMVNLLVDYQIHQSRLTEICQLNDSHYVQYLDLRILTILLEYNFDIFGWVKKGTGEVLIDNFKYLEAYDK